MLLLMGVYMRLILVLPLLVLGSCSRGSGVYRGVATDISWEGWWINSCEVVLKTSDQSSHREFISSTSKDECDELQDHMGKPMTIKYRHQFPSWTTDSYYLIEEVKYE
jgi:hypothetical protein